MVHSAGRPKTSGSPKVEVGEIDTRAPFQSVKDAVNLFGEVAFSGGKRVIKRANSNSAERVLVKESKLHLAEKELNKIKEQLKNAENTKSDALVELDKAKKTVEDLSQKIEILSESKEASLQATEAAKNRTKELEDGNSDKLDSSNGFHKDEYTSLLSDLNSAKQELAKTRQDFETSLEAKASAIKEAEEAGVATKVNAERASEISTEIADLKETIKQVREASLEAEHGKAKSLAEKEAEREHHKSKLEETSKKLELMKKEFDPEVSKNLEAQLAAVLIEIEGLKRDVADAKESDSGAVERVTSELNGAKDSLQKVIEDRNSLYIQVESLRQQLESLRKEHTELKEKEAETESVAGNLHVKLRKYKSELEESIAEQSKTARETDETIASLNQLKVETENARCEAEEMNLKAEELKREAEATRVSLEETENKLTIALQEAEEAKAAEADALEQIRVLSQQADAARSSTSGSSGAIVTISRDEFEALSRKVDESEQLAEMKVSAAMAQVEAVKASEDEAVQRLEAYRKEIEDMKIATDEALKKADMAEAAKIAVEGELRRFSEKEKKKAADVASRILAESQPQAPSRLLIPTLTHSRSQVPTQLRAFKSGPMDYKISAAQDSPTKKLKKSMTSKPKKLSLSSLSGIFQRKKNQVEGGSPSYLPGEN